MAKVKNAVESAPANNETNVSNDQTNTGVLLENQENQEQKKADEKPEPTSEKLVEIRKKLDEKLELVTTTTDKAARLKIVGEIGDLQDEETKELNEIKQSIIREQVQQAKNERIALLTSVVDAARAVWMYEAEYASIPEVEKEGEPGVMVKPAEAMEKMNQLNDAYKNARETVENELLSKFGGVKSVSKPSTGSTPAPAAGKGETGKAIIDLYLANRAANMKEADNIKAIIATGKSRGTVGAVTLAYRRENALEPIS